MRPLRCWCSSILGDRRGMDAIELGKVFIQVRFAKRGNRTLVRGLAVAAMNFLHHVHARDHLAEGSEPHFVELRVVASVDEELRGARIFPSGCESKIPGLVALR